MKATSHSLQIEYEIKPQNKFSLGLKELWQYRELFYFFTWRDVKVKYKQAALGILWAILQPLIMMLMFTLIFSKALRVSSDGIPYPVFAISGLLIWNIFSSGLVNSANSMIANANIIKKIYFPRLIIPMSAILTALVDFLFALIIYAVILIYYHQQVSILKLFLYLPLSILITVITTFGLGTFLAALNVKYRDFQYLLPFMIQFLLFANPVLYSAKAFTNPWINGFMKANPIASAIQLCRSIFTGAAVDWQGVGLGSVVAILFLLTGIYTFRKTETYFADLA
ncbi:MAG: ABC transporter permease [Ginsengibacter sp.]